MEGEISDSRNIVFFSVISYIPRNVFNSLDHGLEISVSPLWASGKSQALSTVSEKTGHRPYCAQHTVD